MGLPLIREWGPALQTLARSSPNVVDKNIPMSEELSVNAQHSRLGAVLAAGLFAVLGTSACSGDGSEAPGAAAGVDDAPGRDHDRIGDLDAHLDGVDHRRGHDQSLRDTFEEDANGWALPPVRKAA